MLSKYPNSKAKMCDNCRIKLPWTNNYAIHSNSFHRIVDDNDSCSSFFLHEVTKQNTRTSYQLKTHSFLKSASNNKNSYSVIKLNLNTTRQDADRLDVKLQFHDSATATSSCQASNIPSIIRIKDNQSLETYEKISEHNDIIIKTDLKDLHLHSQDYNRDT